VFEGEKTSDSRLVFEGKRTSDSRLVFESEMTRGETAGTFQATPLFGRQANQSKNKLIGFLVYVGS
jgi:hypothetical protein